MSYRVLVRYSQPLINAAYRVYTGVVSTELHLHLALTQRTTLVRDVIRAGAASTSHIPELADRSD
jgi:hypothetical protein